MGYLLRGTKRKISRVDLKPDVDNNTSSNYSRYFPKMCHVSGYSSRQRIIDMGLGVLSFEQPFTVHGPVALPAVGGGASGGDGARVMEAGNLGLWAQEWSHRLDAFFVGIGLIVLRRTDRSRSAAMAPWEWSGVAAGGGSGTLAVTQPLPSSAPPTPCCWWPCWRQPQAAAPTTPNRLVVGVVGQCSLMVPFGRCLLLRKAAPGPAHRAWCPSSGPGPAECCWRWPRPAQRWRC